jgi:ribosomal protein L37AE/L43A
MATLAQLVAAGKMWECRKCQAVGLGPEPKVCGFCYPEHFRPREAPDPRTFADRMAGARLDFRAIGVPVPAMAELEAADDPPSARPLAPTRAAGVECRDYRAHQSAHRRTAGGAFVCDRCRAELVL